MNKHVEVTQEDITNGKERVADSCPIALGIRKHLNNDSTVTVTSGRITFYLYDEHKIIRKSHGATPPKPAELFVITYDREGPAAVHPISFNLDIPEDYLIGDK